MKWTNLAPTKLKYHPYQDQFWSARQQRICKKCKTEFSIPDTCPSCKSIGIRKFHRLLMVSGRRGGKTEAGAVAAVQEATIPNTTGWCAAPTNPKLHRYIYPALQRLIPADWVEDWSSEFNDIRLKNGSLIHLQTLEDPDQGRGQGLDWLWIDEICELTEKHWHVIRPSLTEKRGVAFFTTSPRSYDWVYENFYKRAEEKVPGYWAARYATSENPIISQDELDEAQATMPSEMFRQEYEADFVIFTGAVYGEELKEHHILRTKEQVRKYLPEWPQIDQSRQALIGIDTGADHPFGAVKLVSTEQGLIVVGDYLERHKSFVEHAGALHRLAGTSNVRWAINRNERQPRIELAQHGIPCQQSENDIVAGTERVKSWLHQNKLFFVAETAHRTIKQMQAYRWAEANTAPKDGATRKERVYKKDEDLCDALRYAIMTWPMLPKPKLEAEVKRDISGLPEATQRLILRERRIEESTKDIPEGVVGDFWL